ncbi:MAG TPA: tetratricopeptide repeat protein [Candidatus Dormibacteraeota bacterium]|nr:tetratricopeptide repeat protein [Candidatus Dormibacteraeota bacterium]
MRLGYILRAHVMDSDRTIGEAFRKRMLTLCAAVSVLCVVGSAQVSSKTPAGATSSSAERGIALAGKGRCREALPLLKKASAQITDKNLRYDVGMSTARCAIGLEETDVAVMALLELKRRYPKDPEVLYLTTHYYSELALKASHELAETAPSSAQAQQLEAEAFESQGEWDKAITQYQRILEQNPQKHGIHYRMGRVFLSKTPPDAENARKEFEQELKIDPSSAASEFLLGETSRQAGQWEDAIRHFGRAAKLDEGFVEAYLALGISMNAAGKFADAVAPLENYVKMQPDDPAGHYQLATAYARTGRKQDAQQQMALQQETAAKAPRTPPE